jgi:thiamine-phosphate pyrophosphorylase
MVLFAPVFAKTVAGGTLAGAGIEGLRAAVGAAAPLPVLALGGVEAAHARDCLQAGAAGIAGIRLFRQPGWQALKGQG